MRHLLESAHQRKVVNFARGLGIQVTKLNPMGQNGWPDLLVAIPGGKALFIEMKQPGKEPTKLQLHIHAMLRDQGYDLETAQSHEEGKALVSDRLRELVRTGRGGILTEAARQHAAGGRGEDVAPGGLPTKAPRTPRKQR